MAVEGEQLYIGESWQLVLSSTSRNRYWLKAKCCIHGWDEIAEVDTAGEKEVSEVVVDGSVIWWRDVDDRSKILISQWCGCRKEMVLLFEGWSGCWEEEIVGWRETRVVLTP
jgi:hypothetical protein